MYWWTGLTNEDNRKKETVGDRNWGGKKGKERNKELKKRGQENWWSGKKRERDRGASPKRALLITAGWGEKAEGHSRGRNARMGRDLKHSGKEGEKKDKKKKNGGRSHEGHATARKPKKNLSTGRCTFWDGDGWGKKRGAEKGGKGKLGKRTVPRE